MLSENKPKAKKKFTLMKKKSSARRKSNTGGSFRRSNSVGRKSFTTENSPETKTKLGKIQKLFTKKKEF